MAGRSGAGQASNDETPRGVADPLRVSILEAAAILFNRVGFQETTPKAVAERAGCSVAQLHSLFEDTHDILSGLVELLRREADELFFITMPDELPIEEKLRLLAVHQAQWGNRRADALSFFGRNQSLNLQRNQHLDLDQHYLDGTIAWFERHRVDEALNLSISVELAAHVFRALQVGFYKRWVGRGGDESFLDNTTPLLDVFLNGVRKANS